MLGHRRGLRYDEVSIKSLLPTRFRSFTVTAAELLWPRGLSKIVENVMDARLLVARAKADAKQIALGPETLIGRAPECNLRIASGQVSRRHCVVKVADGVVSVRDLGSANGTRLNGQTISTEVDVAIPPGSTLVVGPLKFIVQFAAPKTEGDTELLTRKELGESSEMHELQKMAAAQVVDGEETKDYPPARGRQRGASFPLVVSRFPDGDGISDAEAPGDRARAGQGHSTEADFGALPNETVFDVVCHDQTPDFLPPPPSAAGNARSPVGGETDFLFEEDDLQRLAETVDTQSEGMPGADPAAESPAAAPETDSDGASEKQTGWRLFDLVRRKKNSANPAGGDKPRTDDDDDALRNFLKDS